MTMQNLYERLGGKPAIHAVVAKMYDKILDDELLAPFFENIDVEQLRISQIAFVTYAFGGAQHFTGKGLNTAHRKSVDNGLGDTHFNRVAEYLAASMRELGVTEPLINEALAIVETTREHVLCRNAS